MYYGLQHYLSMAGSLIFIPLIIVPAMGGTDVSIVSHGYHAVFYNTGQELA
jgi:xanthine/uracil permease